MYTRLLISSILGLAVVACTTVALKQDDPEGCIDNKECSVAGVLSFYPAQPPSWIALLEEDNRCVKLAFPDYFFDDDRLRRRWGRGHVTVVGEAFRQPEFDEADGTATLWYTENDRKVGLGMCDGGLGIFVDYMYSDDGDTWSAEDIAPASKR